MNDQQTPASGSGLAPNVASLLCYLCGWITGLIFILVEKENKDVRFHAWQSLLMGASFIVLYIVCTILAFIPFVGLIFGIATMILGLGYFVIWIIAMIKAYQGERWKLPYIGDIAEQKANG